jgi:3-deoxy-D-manno-octulosonic-acid transferase
MLNLYRLFLYLLLPVVVIRLLYRAIRNSQYFERIPQRFGWQFDIPKSSQNGIWIHAVSVGEVNAAGPLVKFLQEKYPAHSITITTMTPTGAERVRKSFGDSVAHYYLPYDYPGAVSRFLEALQPQLGMVMETEIWPNLIMACSKHNIPLIYTNVRLSARSYEGYKKFSRLIKSVLERITSFAVQSEADAKRLVMLGARKESVHITGSIKFEIDLPASVFEASQSVRRSLGWDRPVWVAGSTHEGEESQVLDAFLKAKSECPDLLLVLVPRHPERFNTVYRLCIRYGCNTVLRSQLTSELPNEVEVYMVDTMGELPLLITASDITYIGGSLVATGGHNILEASAAGVAVVFGPHMFNFQEISDQVLARGAGIQIENSDELSDVIVRLIKDPVIRDQYGINGKEFIAENRGALGKIQELVDLTMNERTH